MTVDEAREVYEAACHGQGEESQEFAYLRWRFLAGDSDEAIASANDMRRMVGMPPVGHGLSRNWWAILNSQAGLATANKKAMAAA